MGNSGTGGQAPSVSSSSGTNVTRVGVGCLPRSKSSPPISPIPPAGSFPRPCSGGSRLGSAGRLLPAVSGLPRAAPGTAVTERLAGAHRRGMELCVSVAGHRSSRIRPDADRAALVRRVAGAIAARSSQARSPSRPWSTAPDPAGSRPSRCTARGRRRAEYGSGCCLASWQPPGWPGAAQPGRGRCRTTSQRRRRVWARATPPEALVRVRQVLPPLRSYRWRQAGVRCSEVEDSAGLGRSIRFPDMP